MQISGLSTPYQTTFSAIQKKTAQIPTFSSHTTQNQGIYSPAQRGHFSDRLLSAQQVRFASSFLQKENIPTVDLSQFIHGNTKAKKSFAKALGDGLRKYGFVALKGHGVPVELFNENYKQLGRVFNLEMDTKKQYHRPEIGSQRGYSPLKGELKGSTVDGKKTRPDLKESWHTGRASNVFPNEIPELKPASLKLYHEMEKVGIQLLEAIDMYLNDKGYLKSLVVDDHGVPNGTHLMRSIHYPPVTAQDLENENPDEAVVRAGVHNDMNLITLLPQSTQGGLQIRKRDGSWLSVFAQEGAIIVNAADMLALITEGMKKAIPSTPHKVVGDAQQIKASRFSIPMFIHPNHDKVLKNLKTGKLIEYRHDNNKIPCRDAEEYVYLRLMKHGKSILSQQVSYDAFKAQNDHLRNGKSEFVETPKA